MKKILLTLMLMLSGFGWSQCACVYMDCDGDIICDYYSNCGGNINSCAQSYGKCGNNDCNPTCGNSLQPCQIYPGQGSCGINYMPNGACWYSGGQCNPEVICNIISLPITLINFSGINLDDHNYITFITASEQNNSHFIVYYSNDGVNYRDLIYLPGNVNSSEELSYFVRHYEFDNMINYYKLIQVDYDGKQTQYGPISIDNRDIKRILVKTINTIGQEINNSYKGLVINIYDDGTNELIYR